VGEEWRRLYVLSTPKAAIEKFPEGWDRGLGVHGMQMKLGQVLRFLQSQLCRLPEK
jgi:hypothetical protein